MAIILSIVAHFANLQVTFSLLRDFKDGHGLLHGLGLISRADCAERPARQPLLAWLPGRLLRVSLP